MQHVCDGPQTSVPQHSPSPVVWHCLPRATQQRILAMHTRPGQHSESTLQPIWDGEQHFAESHSSPGAHVALLVHACPLFDRHVPLAQTRPSQHWSSVVHVTPSPWHGAHVPESHAMPLQHGPDAEHAAPTMPQQSPFSQPLPQQSSGLVHISALSRHTDGRHEFWTHV